MSLIMTNDFWWDDVDIKTAMHHSALQRRHNTRVAPPHSSTTANGSVPTGDGGTRLAANCSFSSLNSLTSMTGNCNTGDGYLENRYIHPTINHTERLQKVTINVSGERYQTYVDTLNAFPDTLLGNVIKREKFYDDVEDEYFFDRDRNAFNAILYYYQSKGQLYCPLTVPITILVTEAKFFELGNEALKEVLDLHSKDKKEILPKNKWQRKIWCLFEHPETSRAAHLITIFSVLMIIISVLILCIETLPFAKKLTKRQTTDTPIKHQHIVNHFLNITYRNKSIINIYGTEKLDNYKTTYKIQLECQCKSLHSNDNKNDTSYQLISKLEEVDWHEVFDTCETIFVVWFTFEFILRFLSSPIKVQFLKGFLNIIDIVSILPFYITSALNHHENLGLENFRVIRLVRVFRIFKLSRHSKGLQILGLTLQASMSELGLMIFFIAMGVILFSSALYYLEIDNFTSIPDAFWWAIITMCTVGYGDMVPKTVWGKVVGSACAVCGVLSIALPVPVIVSNFDYFYNRERTKKMHEGFIDEDEDSDDKINDDLELSEIKSHSDSMSKYIPTGSEEKGSPLLNNYKGITRNGSERSVTRSPKGITRNGSERSVTRSPVDTRAEEIHRQQTIRGLQKRNRKISQKISASSLLNFQQNRRMLSGNGKTNEIL